MIKESNNKQSKFKHYILTPVRILNKAKGLMACSGRNACSSPVHIADTKSVVNNVNAPNALNGSERQSLREILRTAPINETRFVTNIGEKVVPIRNNIGSGGVVMQRRQRQRIAGYKYNRNKMSYQTEVRKMGRIDEDKPCYFEEDESDHSISKASLVYLYPRSSRTSTVVKNQTQ